MVLAAASLLACLLMWAGPVVVKASNGAGQPTRSGSGATPTPPEIVLRDPGGRLVNPFLAAEQSEAIVFLFASVDCPISNRYAPVVQRLHSTYSPKGVAFWLVYPNPGDTPAAVHQHLETFGYPVHALLDPRHELVKLTKVSVTPEAAVFDRARTLAYRGRIDNRYVSLGVERPAATQHDLADALGAVLTGTPVPSRPAPAVGCFISDFVP